MELPDVQASAPAVSLALSRVGVTNVEKVVRIGPRAYHAMLDCFVELGPERKGVHMSRFEEVINDVMGSVVLGGGVRVEQMAERIAVEVRERQGAMRAEVRIAATVSAGRELYTLLGTAVVSERGARRLVGVAARVRRRRVTLALGDADVDAAVLLSIVREADDVLGGVLELFADLPDDVFVLAREERDDGGFSERIERLGELRLSAAG
jgi:hypothetical protein